MKQKILFTQMAVAMAATYGVDSVLEQFSVTPTHAQTLSDKIVESSEFLQSINVFPVDEMKGEKILGSVSGLIPTRTDTDNTDRVTSDVLSLGSKMYELQEVDYNAHMKYSTMDAWAKFPNLQEKYGEYMRQQIALARIRVGWIGTSVALPASNPALLGADMNIGWLQLLRNFNSGAQWFDGTVPDSTQTLNEIHIGAGGDFENLDAAVHACKTMVNKLHRNGRDLVAYVGQDLRDDDKARMLAAIGHKPTEKQSSEAVAVVETYAGLPIETPAFFPERGILVTSRDNLSIYFQDSSWRRQIVDNPKRKRVEDFNSVNESYVIEDETKAAGFEAANIKIKEGGAWA